MKLVRFGTRAPRVGAVVDEGKVVDLNIGYAAYSRSKGETLPYARADAELPSDLLDFLTLGKSAIDAAQTVLEYVSKRSGKLAGPSGESMIFEISDITLKPPLPSLTSRIYSVGANSGKHLIGVDKLQGISRSLKQIREEVLAKPLIGFFKLPHNIFGDGEIISVPAWVKFFDYEFEIVAYLGKAGRNVDLEEARQMIVGYSSYDDWSIRHMEAIIGEEDLDKGVYTFAWQKNLVGGSLGPYLVIDEIMDPYSLTLKTSVNGTLRHTGNSSDMIRKFEDMVVEISKYVKLLPGDIIASGSICGTALDSSKPNPLASKPGESRLDLSLALKDRDVVETFAEGIGTMRNEIRFEKS